MKDGELSSLKRLLLCLQKIPTITSKNLHKVAVAFLEKDSGEIAEFCLALTELHRKVRRCQQCWAWMEVEHCPYCSDSNRDLNQLCVVGSWLDMLWLERAADFRGMYHVLGGVLSPLHGVMPENLSIQPLVDRVASQGFKELIFAFSPTPEGEATSAYIADCLQAKGLQVKLSRLASGIPMGASLELMDRVTLAKAFSERQSF